MQRARWALIGTFVVAFLLDSSAPGADKRGLESGFLSLPRGSPVPSTSKRSSVRGLLMKSGDGVTKVNRRMVESLNELLKSATDPKRRALLLLNRAALYNSLGKQEVLKETGQKASTEGRYFFGLAIKDANEAMLTPALNADALSRGNGILGFSYTYLGEHQRARENFIQALERGTQVEGATYMILISAESLFESEKYTEAYEFYRKYFNRLTSDGRSIAYYRMAWCMINLNRSADAEELFLRVLRRAIPATSHPGVEREALRDLAYLLAHHPDSQDAIDLARKIFPAPQRKEEQMIFLRSVCAALENQNSISNFTKVIDRMLQLEENPAERVSLLLLNLRVNRRLFASHIHLDAFSRVDQALMQWKHKGGKKLPPEIQESLDLETEVIIKAFTDTFAGRARTPERFTTAELGDALKHQFDFFVTYCADAPLLPRVLNLNMDVCVELEDWQCQERATENVLTRRRRMPQLIERALIDQLHAIEQLELAGIYPPGKRTQKKRKLMAEVYGRYPAAPRWLGVTKKYAELLYEDGDLVSAIPVLEKILAVEKTDDARYRLLLALHKSKNFERVLADDQARELSKTQERFNDIRKESALALATKARSDDDTPNYRRYMKQFLELCKDVDKARVARADLFNYLLTKDMYGVLAEELRLTPLKLRDAPEFSESVSRAWVHLMLQAEFALAAQVIEGQTSAAMMYRAVLTKIASEGRMPHDAVGRITADERAYLFGLFALTTPDVLLELIRAETQASRPAQSFVELALRMKSGRWEIFRTSLAQKYLGTKYPYAVESDLRPLAMEQKIDAVSFPTKTDTPERTADLIKNAVQVAQQVERSLAKVIAGRADSVAISALEKAASLEHRIGAAVLASGVPAGLSPEDEEKYRVGLRDGAKPFFDQEGEFRKALVTLKERVDEDSRARKERMPNPPRSGGWTWPRNLDREPGLSGVRKAFGSGKYTAALLLADLARAEKVLDDDDYFRLRGGILLTSSSSEAMRSYVREELVQNKQERVVEDWRQRQIPDSELKGDAR